jgi:dihydroflavonol-4-reductase
MQTLVLGASGFIGGHIARAALAAGWRVRGLRRDPASTGHLEDAPVDWRTGDLNDGASLQAAMQGVDLVFHAAAYYPKSQPRLAVAEHGARAQAEIETVLDALRAAGVPRLVFTSTLTTIDLPPAGRLADERDFYQPDDYAQSAYFAAKIAMENTVLAANGSDLEVVVTNPTAVFGPGDVHITLGSLLIAAARGYAFFWLPVTTNVIDVRDVAAAHIAAAERGRPGERYILGGHNLSVRAALTIANRVAGRWPPWLRLPLWPLEALANLGNALPFLPLPANHLRSLKRMQAYNTAKAESELGLRARPFDETVRDALDWFRRHGHLD